MLQGYIPKTWKIWGTHFSHPNISTNG